MANYFLMFTIMMTSLLRTEEMFNRLAYFKLSFNIGAVFLSIFLVNYIEYKLEKIRLMEIQDDNSIIVEMKLKAESNKEMQLMFESLEDAIVLVDKDKIAF
jgi:uncharacterized membrane protein